MDMLQTTLLNIAWLLIGFVVGWLLRSFKGYYHVARHGFSIHDFYKD